VQQSNCEVLSDSKSDWFLQYTDVYIGEPTLTDKQGIVHEAWPFECRLRDLTYSAPIKVNVRFTRGKQIVNKTGLQIGSLPIMLRSTHCHLTGKPESKLAAKKECPYDPGGYFVIKGVEKVILMQEQLSKNRVIIELDNKGNVSAAITSSTHERKSRCNIYMKHGKCYLKHNTLGDDIPIVVMLKAMGLESDQEIVQLVGSEPELVDAFGDSIEEVCNT
jgi:DNA-directed RNA polymerase III subunit RPC2